jgi:NTE family protein
LRHGTRSGVHAALSAERQVNLALQGGGAHGAFTLGRARSPARGRAHRHRGDQRDERGRDERSRTRYAAGGREGARQALDRFWISTSEYAIFSPIQRTLIEQLLGR